MTFASARRYLIGPLLIVLTALLLSAVWNVPYVHTAIGFACWAFFGHLITIDDDLPGGWSNPDGDEKFPLVELVVKAAVLTGLIAAGSLFPVIRTFGA